MAELDAPPLPPGPATQSRAQLAAVAWLRWRIFINAFRRKGSTGSFVLMVVGRILAWCIVACFFVVPVVGCGLAAYFQPNRLGMLLWAVFSVNLFVSINITPATLGFDLTPLLRFPLGFSRYVLVRLFFGFFAIATVVANLALASAAIGTGVANHALFPWAALVLAIFALHNVFFIRMVFAWVDRWMGTRRAREIFGGLVVLGSLGIQLIFTGNAHHTAARLRTFSQIGAQLHPVMQYLPPSLAADAIGDYAHGDLIAAGVRLLALVAFSAAALAIFALRLKKEFRGENLSEASRRATRTEPKPRPAIAAETAGAETLSPTRTGFRLPPTIAACVTKEWIYLKRSGSQLYGLITPLVLIFILARRHGIFSNTPMLLPYAVGYVLLGLLANLYNVLGADAAGFSLYLLAPIRLRDVILSKNLVYAGVIALEILLACGAVSIISGQLPPGDMLAATLSWAAFAALANFAIGNLRSLYSPMRFELGKARRAPAAKGSAFITLGIFVATLVVGIPVIYFCRRVQMLWLATPIFLALTAAAFVCYLVVLGQIDAIAMARRDELSTALCKS